jgi:hypothetical protein
MNKLLTIFCILTLLSCSITTKVTQTPDFVNEQNYFNYRITEPGITEHLFDKDAISDSILSYLKKRGFVVEKNVSFKLKDGTVIPATGYLPYEKIGFYVEPTVTYPKDQSMRTNPFCEYLEYGADSSAYILSFKDAPKNLFIFKANWYWWQSWMNKYYSEQNKNKVLITEDFAHKLLQSDIEKYFGKIVPQK